MKNRAEIQRQNNSTLNNVFNNIQNNIFNKVFKNISMTLVNLTINLIDIFFLGMLNVGSACTPNANLEVN